MCKIIGIRNNLMLTEENGSVVLTPGSQTLDSVVEIKRKRLLEQMSNYWD